MAVAIEEIWVLICQQVAYGCKSILGPKDLITCDGTRLHRASL